MGRTLVGVLWCISGIAQAITVTPGGSSASLMASLTAPGTGLTVTGLSIDGHGAAGLASWGTYTNASGTYGIGPGIVISSGRVSVYGDGPNTSTTRTTDYGATATAAQSAILADISGAGDFYDVTQVNVTFDLDATTDSVYFDVTFGSEEFPE